MAHITWSVPFFIECRVTSHLYAFFHTLENFSICSLCDFSALVEKVDENRSHPLNEYILFHNQLSL